MLKLILSVVSYLTKGASALVDGTASFIYSAFMFNFVLIRAACGLIVSSVNSCLDLISNVIYACHCGILDFASFIYDVLDICSSISTAFSRGFLQLWLAITTLVSTFCNLTWVIWLAILTFINISFSIIGIVMQRLFDLTYLVGRSIKLLTLLFPTTFIKFAQLAFKLIQFISEWTLKNLLWTFSTALNYVKYTFIFAKSQSIDVYIGILAVVLVCYGFKRRGDIRRFLSRLSPLFNSVCGQVRLMTPNISSMLPEISLRRQNAPLFQQPIADEVRIEPPRGEVADEASESEDETPRGTPSSMTPKARRPLKKVNTPCETNLAEELERLRDSQLCVICQDAIRCIILLPCRHLCLCQPCVRRMFQHQVRCPICRSLVHDSLQVYS